MPSISRFATDTKKEKEGVWCDAGAGLRVLIRRINNPDSQAYLRRYARTLGRALKHGSADESTTKQVEDISKVNIAKNVLVGWENLQDEEGVNIPYSSDKALDLLNSYPDFLTMVLEFAGDADLFRTESIEDVKGN